MSEGVSRKKKVRGGHCTFAKSTIAALYEAKARAKDSIITNAKLLILRNLIPYNT